MAIPDASALDDAANDGFRRVGATRHPGTRMPHFPSHFGGRFSANAFGPSM